MKQLIYFLIFLSICSFKVRAQTETNAQNILNNAALNVQSSKGISLNFSLIQKDKSNHILSNSKGILKIKGLKYYVKQGNDEIFSNGDQVWNFDGHSEVTVTNVDNDDDELSPQQIITGFSQNDFDIKMLSSSGVNYSIQLMPKDKRKNFKQIVLYINKSSNLITKASITDKTNAVTEITFSNIALNTVIPDTQFSFDASKHPGIEVINE